MLTGNAGHRGCNVFWGEVISILFEGCMVFGFVTTISSFHSTVICFICTYIINLIDHFYNA